VRRYPFDPRTAIVDAGGVVLRLRIDRLGADGAGDVQQCTIV
jgi:hypothetical protein